MGTTSTCPKSWVHLTSVIINDSINAGLTPWSISVDHESLWVANRIGHGSSVTRIDKATETIVATIPVDTAPRVVAVDGSSVWAVSSNNVVAQIEVGDQPRGLGDMTGFEFDFFFGPVVDTTPPVITSAISGTLGLNDWYTSDVTVEWTVTDPEPLAPHPGVKRAP